jgi:formate/nitrite transporter FocA (FNT family)
MRPSRETAEIAPMSVIVLGALFTLAVLVMALAGSQLAQRTLMLMVVMTAAVVLAVWLLSRPA